MTEAGFCKAQSDNLPVVDAIMVAEYFQRNDCFALGETRGVKTDKAGRQSYGDTAIGWVQVRRVRSVCTVKAKITPEHNVTKKQYNVTMTLNEASQKVVTVQCHDCAASAGGCKHAAALLMWVHRRSEEPSPTEVTCYWQKSKLANVGSSLKYLSLKDFGEKPELPSDVDSANFLKEVIATAKESGCDSQILKHFDYSDVIIQNLGLYQLMLSFVGSGQSDCKDFFKHCTTAMKPELCKQAADNTVEQSDSSLWFELRYARITASKLYQAAHCKKSDGVFVDQVIDVNKLRDTAAMQRGRKLECEVVKCLEKKLNVQFQFTGLQLCPEHPVIGASPDAICDDYIVEIKCPQSEKTFHDYITKSNNIAAKHNSQVQLQMFIFKKKKALFCVADPNFESNNKFNYIFVEYDAEYTKNIISATEDFWQKNIFHILYDSCIK